MKVVIIGTGNVGENITKLLAKEGHDILVIDKEIERINQLVNSYDVKGLCGNGVVVQTLKDAEIEHADVVICVSEDDELNIISALIAKQLGAKTAIARLRKIEYHEQYEFMRETLGIDLLINPEKETAREIANLLRFPYALNVVPFAGGKMNGLTIEVPEDCNLVGVRIGDIEKQFEVNVVVYAIEKDDKFIIPDEDYVIEVQDKVSFIAKPDVMRTFSTKIGFVKNRIKNVMIIGGSKIAFYLSQMLIENKISVKIVEKDKQMCDEITESIDGVSIVLANTSDYNVLQEEGVDDIDAFISLTGNDEENIVLSLYAQSRGIKHIVTKIDNKEVIDIAKEVDMKKCISTKSQVAVEIVKYLRNLSNEKQENNPMNSLSMILSGNGEVIEFEISETDEKFTKTPFKQIKLIKNTIIACVLRENDVIIPNSTDLLLPHDKILVVTKNKEKLESLNNILR